jgi:ankyrin repeat protein
MESEYWDDDEDARRPMIHRAAGRGDTETAKRLLDEDPDSIHARNELDNEPLHEASWAKQPAMVRLLLDRGADVNAVGDSGRTPLHFAVWDGGTGAVEIVEMLVQAGADVNAQDERLQENALGFALREFKDELEPAIRMLREKGSSLGLAGAMILGDKNRVRLLLNESEEPLSVELVQHIHVLSKDCGQNDISQMISEWLKQNAENR